MRVVRDIHRQDIDVYVQAIVHGCRVDGNVVIDVTECVSSNRYSAQRRAFASRCRTICFDNCFLDPWPALQKHSDISVGRVVVRDNNDMKVR